MDKETLIIQLQNAATGMLTDAEIRDSLSLSDEEMRDNYHIVSQARVKLKQELNAKRVTDPERAKDYEAIINTIPRNTFRYKSEGHGPYANMATTRGGKRNGAGRAKGSTNKLTGAMILETIFATSGEKFETLLAQGYQEAIESRDKYNRLQYEKLIMSKVVSDKVEIVIDEDIGINFKVKKPEKQ